MVDKTLSGVNSYTSLDAAGLDTREQLFNQGTIGPIAEISLPEDRVVDLTGILLDVDQRLFKLGPLLPTAPTDPSEFYTAVVSKWLDRHPVLQRAEVRNSGRGLHLILRPDAPIRLDAPRDRQKWKGLIKLIQAALPTDPNAPGLNALTRPIGSINGKNGATVNLLRAGEPIPAAKIEALAREIQNQPFKAIFQVLAGQERHSPCPICGGADKTLVALDRAGKCYGCGNVTLAKLFDSIFANEATAKVEG